MVTGPDGPTGGSPERPRRLEFDWATVLAIGLGVAVGATLLLAAVTSSSAFGPFNPAWDGGSDLRTLMEDDADVESDLIHETTAYEEVSPSETVAFVVAPDAAYTGEDARRVRSFVSDGGTLVVFEDVGEEGNALLESVGADARLDGRPLRDDHSFSRGPKLPVATRVANHSVTAEVEQLTLNRGTAVAPGPNATTLVGTNPTASLQGERGPAGNGFVVGTYPVVTVEPVGEGRTIVVGDPSITINAMLDRPDNAAFIRGLYAEDERVLLDASHVDDPPAAAVMVERVRETPALQASICALGITIIGVLGSRRGVALGGRLVERLVRRIRRSTHRVELPNTNNRTRGVDPTRTADRTDARRSGRADTRRDGRTADERPESE